MRTMLVWLILALLAWVILIAGLYAAYLAMPLLVYTLWTVRYDYPGTIVEIGK